MFYLLMIDINIVRIDSVRYIFCYFFRFIIVCRGSVCLNKRSYNREWYDWDYCGYIFCFYCYFFCGRCYRYYFDSL